MNNRPPLQEQFDSQGWRNWFTQLFQCLPWKKGINITATLDFGSIPSQSQVSLTATVTGARADDAVLVTPNADVVGLIFGGIVTGNDQVTVYAKNFTAGAINPPSTTFRIIVLQN